MQPANGGPLNPDASGMMARDAVAIGKDLDRAITILEQAQAKASRFQGMTGPNANPFKMIVQQAIVKALEAKQRIGLPI